MLLPDLPPNDMQVLERRISKTVNEAFPQSLFDANKISSKQKRRMAVLPEQGDKLHRTWCELGDGRLSAACCYEWARLQLFLAVEVMPILRSSDMDFHHVTVVDKRWRADPGSADGTCFDRPRRKVRAAIDLLRTNGFSPVYIAAYEVSGDRNLAGNYSFEPHVHLLVGGVSEAALKIAFEVRLPRSERGRHKPIRVSPVAVSDLQNVLSYLTKMKAQDRVEYIGSNGRPNRVSNHMPPDDEVQWLRCMATMPIAQTIQFGGFAEPITSRFMHLEMATMLGESQ